jgi:hypothetical protein
MAYTHQLYWLEPEPERAQVLHPLRNNARETGATISHQSKDKITHFDLSNLDSSDYSENR